MKILVEVFPFWSHTEQEVNIYSDCCPELGVG